ncbi:hypothetical protein L228DRAFT_270201 [Xylona heveae TC161]|uniref:Uncharacterized protein n=1 Tax=Xylona heveae (strain CBS 132557 / TC161) TaxID=1328760 RepID=A0A165FGB1_XYLHT|nr:hypothetical protein L228DRAFT_270201 [Xylona heveae TC161]KZF20941.1 hypothetical protein L228DRAFT_270201 [Xylona heveae TC161]
MLQPNAKLRRLVLTGSVAAITATGAWYGAGIKTRQEYNAEQRARAEALPVDRVAQLNQARESLMATKAGLEGKIAQLERRGADKNDKDSLQANDSHET